MYKTVLILFSVFLCNNIYAQETFPSENIYWPGDFEQSLFGGNFSRARGVEISDLENHTPNGKRSWSLTQNNYQHIELLTEGKGKFLVRFYAKANSEIPVIIKEVFKTGEKEHVTEDYTVLLKGDNQWHFYETEIDVQKPYPGPRTGEVLITCFNNGGAAWIDDLEIRRNSEDLEKEFIKVNGCPLSLLPCLFVFL